METAAREGDTLFNELRGIRQRLSECCSMADRMHEKLTGPTPKDAAKVPQEAESIVSLICDINRHVHSLQIELGFHHSFVGDVGVNGAAIGGSPLRH